MRRPLNYSDSLEWRELRSLCFCGRRSDGFAFSHHCRRRTFGTFCRNLLGSYLSRRGLFSYGFLCRRFLGSRLLRNYLLSSGRVGFRLTFIGRLDGRFLCHGFLCHDLLHYGLLCRSTFHRCLRRLRLIRIRRFAGLLNQELRAVLSRGNPSRRTPATAPRRTAFRITIHGRLRAANVVTCLRRGLHFRGCHVRR